MEIDKPLYAERDIMEQGEHYGKHVSAMTGEGLHSKSAIAAELAHRDIEIERLKGLLIAAAHLLDALEMPLSANEFRKAGEVTK